MKFDKWKIFWGTGLILLSAFFYFTLYLIFRDPHHILIFMVGDIAFVFMGNVDNPDILVIIADFFLRLSEITWSIVAGICEDRVVIILRNAGLRGDAGRMAKRLFGRLGGFAGGHKSAARAEITLKEIRGDRRGRISVKNIILDRLKIYR